MFSPVDMITVESRPVKVSSDQFWTAISIFNNQTHTVNERLSGVVSFFVGRVLDNVEYQSCLDKVQGLDLDCRNGEIPKEEIVAGLQSIGLNVEDTDEDENDLGEKRKFIIVKNMLSKNLEKYGPPCLSVTILDKDRDIASFASMKQCENQNLVPVFPYSLVRSENEIKLVVYSQHIAQDHVTLTYLTNKVLRKVSGWALRPQVKSANRPKLSLELVDVDSYFTLYNTMKKKYCKQLIKTWPENTDPRKFVYEDLAIASYLMTLWEKERAEKRLEKKQSFLDLGCGNGLLVHILCSEGYPGLGLDVRRRKIWDLYAETTRLEVRSITPSDSMLFPEFDWLIGNHSDELTPWIPVIAARSSYHTRFFVLPCCTYDFNSKYQRPNAAQSQYQHYLDYIKTVSELCGFETVLDRLRIPSTKRLCLVGQNRTYSVAETRIIDEKIKEFINLRCQINKAAAETDIGVGADEWVHFEPRPAMEKVRNCTQLNKSLLEDIVTLVTRYLLMKRRSIEIIGQNNQLKMWNAGGSVSLNEIAKAISKKHLQRLKNECGGLQTLLKNHHQIFSVIDGNVQLKMPTVEYGQMIKEKMLTDSKVAWKSKQCWFHYNHPDGCPLPDEDCSFLHTDSVNEILTNGKNLTEDVASSSSCNLAAGTSK